MSWFTKKAPDSFKPQPRDVNLSPDDDLYERAEKIWYSLGLGNDRRGCIPQIAFCLSVYQAWDFKKENTQ